MRISEPEVSPEGEKRKNNKLFNPLFQYSEKTHNLAVAHEKRAFPTQGQNEDQNIHL